MDGKPNDVLSKERALRVRLMAPTNGALYAAPATIVLAATLTSPRRPGGDAGGRGDAVQATDGSESADRDAERQICLRQQIVKVEFFEGDTLGGTAAATPYAYIWTNVPSGNYVLTARATSARGLIVQSAGVAIAVDAPPAAGVAVHAERKSYV